MRKILWFFMVILMTFTTACSAVSHSSNESYKDSGSESFKNVIIDSSQPIDGTYEPLEITEILVRQETEHEDWELTDLEVYKDKTIDNISDYDKPVGKMRVVWVTGHVKNNDSSLNVDLELYKLEGDDVWYIGTHWGILASIAVPEQPIVDESNYELSEDEDIFQDDINFNEHESTIVESEENYIETDEYFIELENRFLSVLNEHFESAGLIQYLEDGKLVVKDTGMKQMQDRREYIFDLEGTLTNEFNDLSLADQYSLLAMSDYGVAEFYEGNMFLLGDLGLTIDSDLYTVETYNYILKNNEMFLPY